MTIDKMIEVLQAASEGKSIESRGKGHELPWIPAPDPCWDFSTREYRVKPEMQVCYVNFYPGCGIGGAYATSEEAGEDCHKSRIACVRIEYTEGQFDV